MTSPRTTKLLRLLQLDDLTWSTVAFQELTGRALTVFFAYGILAWNRFGLLSFTSPRAPVRFVLIGIYSWLAIGAVLWLASRRTNVSVPPKDAAVAAAIVHVPLVALGFFMAIVAGFARILGPGVVLAVIALGLWMPAVLARAMHGVVGLKWPQAVAAAVVVQLLWLAGTGRYLYDQVGHLL